ncbi:hypothetical protein LCGC14_1002650 [marine sediment metagenome]|uniref:Uncharacterized protein n=1 Tax=marine sediment metagenome TaxID=412755 RepID=A0A0F9NP29_9ZZZZ
MQTKIAVTVQVSSEEHADQIKKDIEDAIKMRTTIYFIGTPKVVKVNETIELLWKEEFKRQAEAD